MSKKKDKKDKKDKEQSQFKKVAVNKKAYHDYEIIEKFEAGMLLVGSEVKSVREGRISLKDSYVDIRKREAFLVSLHIGPYSNASYNNHEPERERKLLLHKQELKKLDKKVKTRGFTIVPLKVYITAKGLIKVEIALVKGKAAYDKKQLIKDRDIQREVDRDLKNYRQ
jgi:SsrA-binding protein